MTNEQINKEKEEIQSYLLEQQNSIQSLTAKNKAEIAELTHDLDDKESLNLELRQHKKYLKSELDKRDDQIEQLVTEAKDHNKEINKLKDDI